MKLVKRFRWKELVNDTLTEPCGYSTPSTEWVILNPKDGFSTCEDAETGLLSFAAKSKDFCQLENLILVEFYSVDYDADPEPEPSVKVLYRQQRGSWEDSLATTVEVSSLQDIANMHNMYSLVTTHAVDVRKLTCSFYANDHRHSDWYVTYIIVLEGYGPLGFSNGSLT